MDWDNESTVDNVQPLEYFKESEIDKKVVALAGIWIYGIINFFHRADDRRKKEIR